MCEKDCTSARGIVLVFYHKTKLLTFVGSQDCVSFRCLGSNCHTDETHRWMDRDCTVGRDSTQQSLFAHCIVCARLARTANKGDRCPQVGQLDTDGMQSCVCLLTHLTFFSFVRNRFAVGHFLLPREL